jgi:hypothetical protein
MNWRRNLQQESVIRDGELARLPLEVTARQVGIDVELFAAFLRSLGAPNRALQIAPL